MKTIVLNAVAAKPEVEIWRRPVFGLNDPDFLFDPPNTLWGLTRTVTELPGGNLSIRITVTDTHIFRNLTEFFSNSNKAISFKFS